MRAVIPFKKSNAKSRLSTLLCESEREDLAMSMLTDVAGTLAGSGCFDVVDILSTSPVYIENTNIVLTEMGLNEALNEYLRQMSSHNINEPVLIIMADIPLVSKKNIQDIVSSRADIVIAPGRMGGTNTIFIRKPQSFHVDYYGPSFLKHLAIAKNLNVEVFDSFNLSTDIDEVSDLAEILIHGKGYSKVYLERIGISLLARKGRVGVERL
ncbi:MAG: 2-phospho-L-lactate guanylyltransferase [Candidatus Methanoperedens sp.]|nr:2-phospho-L-lactate guanylyltransferase [Candidatus Methanoperedens sp.]